MKLFVGLGNPGAEYEATRHNIGFLAVDAIAREHRFAPERAKFQGRLGEGRLGAERVAILKPETYMNLSGQSVGEALRFFKLEPSDVYVFHDELDLPPGRVKVKTGGGHAGHNGLRSIDQHIGPDTHRVRIGIGHPGDRAAVSGYVLHPFAKADRLWVEPLLAAIAAAAPWLAAQDPAGFLNRIALATQPPKERRAREDAEAGVAPRPKGAPRTESDDASAPKKPGRPDERPREE